MCNVLFLEIKILTDALRIHSLRNDHIAILFTMIRISGAQKRTWVRSKDPKFLQDAIANYHRASETCEALGIPKLKLSCHYELANCCEALSHITSDATDYAMVSLEHLKKAASLLDMTRHESFVLPTLQSLRSKQYMRGEFMEQSVHKMAIRLCRELDLLEDCWNWIQMNKARSLSDLMGMSAIIPSYLLEKIRADPEALELFNEESRLAQSLETKPPKLRYEERKLLENQRKKMEKVPVLEELFILRDGKPEILQNLDWLFMDNERCVVVDWMCLDTEILMAIVDSTRKPNIPLALRHPKAETGD